MHEECLGFTHPLAGAHQELCDVVDDSEIVYRCHLNVN